MTLHKQRWDKVLINGCHRKSVITLISNWWRSIIPPMSRNGPAQRWNNTFMRIVFSVSYLTGYCMLYSTVEPLLNQNLFLAWCGSFVKAVIWLFTRKELALYEGITVGELLHYVHIEKSSILVHSLCPLWCICNDLCEGRMGRGKFKDAKLPLNSKNHHSTTYQNTFKNSSHIGMCHTVGTKDKHHYVYTVT